MRSAFMCVIASTLLALIGAASACEGFNAYTDPTLPTGAIGCGHGAGGVGRGRSSNAPSPAITTSASNRPGHQGTLQIVAKRSAPLPHQVAHGFDRAHSSQVN